MFIRDLGSILTGGNILLLEILLSRSKASDANIGIIANFASLYKNYWSRLFNTSSAFNGVWEENKRNLPL